MGAEAARLNHSVVPDTFKVRVLCTDTGPKLVAAIELSAGQLRRRLAKPMMSGT